MKCLNRCVPYSFSSVIAQLSLLFFLFLYSFSTLADQIEPIAYRKVLEHVLEAQGQQNFEGKFRYSRPNYQIETYIHQQMTRDGQVNQWIRMLGSEEGFLNVNGKIQCITKGYKNKFRINSILQSIKISDLDALLRDYTILSGNDLEVAGRKARELIFISKDQDRYMYKLAFDKLTYFPLAFVFIDNKCNVLERGGFVEFRPVLSEEVHVKPMNTCIAVSYKSSSAEGKRLWVVDIIPSGFTLVRVNNDAKLRDEHQIYSDGLVSFSIFIEPLVNDDMDGIKRNIGATVFVAKKLVDPKTENKYLVIIVGEIPFATAERIINSAHIK